MRSVTDREGYVRARVDYLNSLFTENGYLVASAENPIFTEMQGLIPRVTVLVTASSHSSSFRDEMLRALPVTPLEVHNLDEEVQKVGGDMFVYLARANMNLYLLGGLLLALVSILTIALVNYSEDRRTLALLRIRGASPDHIRRFVIALILSPALLGVAVGGGSQCWLAMAWRAIYGHCGRSSRSSSSCQRTSSPRLSQSAFRS